MRRARLTTIGVLLAVSGLLVAALAASAGGAKIRVGNLVIRADGGFEPRVLPRRSFAPIRFQGHASIATTDGSAPPALRRVRLDFDRDGLLTTAGLATCAPGAIEGMTPKRARNRCRAAIVGTGRVGATIALPGARVAVRAPLTLFNGPRQGGNATVIAHSQTTVPVPQAYVVTVPIERRRGAFAYRSTFDLPEIAGGLGALTRVRARIGRRYRAGGVQRSFVSARCSDGILETHGYLSFADGTVISGSVFKPCRSRP
jgi:hypothetical protein